MECSNCLGGYVFRGINADGLKILEEAASCRTAHGKRCPGHAIAFPAFNKTSEDFPAPGREHVRCPLVLMDYISCHITTQELLKHPDGVRAPGSYGTVILFLVRIFGKHGQPCGHCF